MNLAARLRRSVRSPARHARAAAVSFATILIATTAFAATPSISLDRLFSDPPVQGRIPRQAELSPAGHWVGFLRPAVADSEELELWAQPANGGAPRRLASGSELLAGHKQQLSEAEKMALERRRISEHGITSWQWCGKDDRRLLFPLGGALWIVQLDADGARARALAGATDDPARDPRCSPDGRQVAFVRGGNLWVQSLEAPDASPRALTTDATETRFYGLAEFIAAEELGRERGFWWSPDGTRLLALQVDESAVPLKTRAQIFSDHTAVTTQRYPSAGSPNAKVAALVLDVADGRRMTLQQPAGSEYVARADWFDDGTPWLQLLTRDQATLSLVEYDRATDAPHVITEERDPAWVETHDDLAEVKGVSLSGKPALLWPSESSGRRQLVLLDRATGERRPLTAQAESVAALVCTDGKQVVFEGALEQARSRDLFVSDLAGHVHPLGGAVAHEWRTARADRDCSRLLVTRSGWGQPPTLSIRGLRDDEPVVALAGDPPDPLLAKVATQPEVLPIVAADGRTPLNAFWFAPAKANGARRHPVIVLAYGGPTAETVTWAWARNTVLIAHWQQLGYGVFMVDNRGMAAKSRDHDFTRAHFHAFGHVEIDDLFAAVRQLAAKKPDVDPARIGQFGWSYGGYLAARSMLDDKTPFAAAVAVAPVTDWTLYDTAYTERYLGLPMLADGSESPFYHSANLVPRAAQLRKPLLVMHGTADDNVLFEHSLRLIEALENEGRLFDLAIFPGKAHGISGRKAQLDVYKNLDAFFAGHLQGGER